MALYSITLSFTDGENHRATTQVNIDAATEQDAIDAAEAVGTQMQLLSDARLTSITYTRSVDVANSNPTGPTAQSNVEEKGMLSFLTDESHLTRFSIPAIKDAAKVANSGALLTSYAPLAALITLATGTPLSDARGEAIVSLVSAEQTYGRKR